MFYARKLNYLHSSKREKLLENDLIWFTPSMRSQLIEGRWSRVLRLSRVSSLSFLSGCGEWFSGSCGNRCKVSLDTTWCDVFVDSFDYQAKPPLTHLSVHCLPVCLSCLCLCVCVCLSVCRCLTRFGLRSFSISFSSSGTNHSLKPSK
jgi:hypothetical protein